MKIIRGKDLEFIPASHEEQQNPEVWKKVLFVKDQLIDGRVQMINWAKLPVGKSFRRHYHEDMDEIFIILNGKIKMEVDEEQEELGKGDAILTPMKHSHKMTNISGEDVEYIVLGISLGQNGKTIMVAD
jgi:mannose-6-phosphate isomerase-like protein (cupin superfamily)